MFSQWTPRVITNGNPTNVSNKQKQGPIIGFYSLTIMSFNRSIKKPLHLKFLSGLARIVVNEQCLIFFPLGQSSTCKIHMFQILKTILCSCNELAQCFRALFMSPNEKNLIHKYLWHQQRKNLHNIFQQHTRPNNNIYIYKCSRKEILHFNSYFHLANVNIAPFNTLIIPLQNKVS